MLDQDFIKDGTKSKMPIDHTSIPVPFSKVDQEVAWFLAAYGHMGFKVYHSPVPGVVGVGDETGPFLWISGFDHNFTPIPDDAVIFRTHLALSAKGKVPLPGPLLISISQLMSIS